MAGMEFDEERVTINKLEAGDIIRPPLTFESAMLVNVIKPCPNIEGWYHMLLRGVPGESLVEYGSACVDGTDTITRLHLKIKYFTGSGKDFIESLKASMA